MWKATKKKENESERAGDMTIKIHVIEYITWCARAIRLRSCFFKNDRTTSPPNVQETPRSLSPQPVMSWKNEGINQHFY